MSDNPGLAGTRIKLGIVANEFFDRDVGRIGGFGWAAARVRRTFAEDPEIGVDVVFLPGEVSAAHTGAERIVHGTRLLSVGAAPNHEGRNIPGSDAPAFRPTK